MSERDEVPLMITMSVIQDEIGQINHVVMVTAENS